MKIQARESFIETNGLRLHVVTAGPEDGPLVVLLHGFPDFWYGWREQIPALAAAGYRVVVPDQRGYNRSDKPAGIAAYAVEHLADDIAGLIAALGRARATVVGHDWGGGIAWYLGMTRPDLVERLVVLNSPHPAVLADQLRHNPAQLRRSWYMFAFQIPRLPEALWRANNYRMGLRALVSGSLPGTFPFDILHQYRAAWAQPWALTAMINWYRAAVRKAGDQAGLSQPVTLPTLIIWGERDEFLVPEMAEASLAYCPQGRLARVPEAGHWVKDEAPAAVNRLLLDWLAAPPQSSDNTPADSP